MSCAKALGQISLWILGARGRLVGLRVENKEGCGEDEIREVGRGRSPWGALLSDRRRAE